MKNLSKKICLSVVFLGAALPLFALAQTNPADNPANSAFQLVPCSGISSTDPTTGAATIPCDYNYFITMVQRFINLLLYAAAFIAVVLIVYAGFLYLTAGGNTSKTSKAHAIFRAVVIGMVISFTAWTVVFTVTSTLKPNGTNTLINPSFVPIKNGAPTGNSGSIIPLKQQ